MPNTKFSFIRCRILDKCFRSPVKRYQIQDLIDACEEELNMKISRRTIYYDIDFMKSNDGWNAPIDTIREGNCRYYYYTDSDFSIDNVPLTEAQLKQIHAAVDVLKTMNGLPQFEGLGDSLEKIGMMTYDTSVKPCFELDYNADVKGTEHITPLFNAIQANIVLKITYKPFDEEAQNFIFHPQFLKQYNGSWFVFGLEQSHPNLIWNFPLDRIQNLEPTDYPYSKMDKDWNDYFYDIIGVTNDSTVPLEEVHFLVRGKTAHIINNKPLHGTQKQTWIDNQTLDVRIHVKINYELKRTLLSYAPSITILAPQSLVEEHKKDLQKAMDQYR